jgi:colanic acid biosynthesis glycosyl transferase WcaI
MAERLLGKGVPPEQLMLLPNWADALPADPPGPSFRASHGIPADAKIALYAGNMAGKQGLETLVEAARLLQQRSDIWFVLVGDGPARAGLQTQAQGLQRVMFLPLQPLSQLGAMLRAAEVHLLPQRAAATDLVLPSKLGGMFASGRPTVAGAQTGSALANMLEGRGVVVTPEDAQAFADAVSSLCDDQQRANALGAAAQAYVSAELSRDAVLARLHAALQQAHAAPVTT